MATGRDRRRSARVAVDLPVELRFTLEPAVHGRARNLSREGIFAETPAPYAPGTLVRMRLEVDGAEPVMAVGVVARVVEHRADATEPPGVGIFLTSTNEAWERYFDDLALQLRAGSA
jgi:hypothetical protein